MRSSLSRDPVARLQRNYTPALLAHLTSRNESTLRAAYELGRGAIADGVGMLDLVHVHHAVFLDVASSVREVGELADILDAAASFLMEALAPFEMTQQPPGRRESG
jgi:Phosphoserine phosphatase RsbU, N-terminal domain